MKRFLRLTSLVLAIFMLILLALWYSFFITKQHLILRLPWGFFPEVTHLEKNESARFINLTQEPSWPASGPHPTHINYPEFDPQENILPGQTWAYTFNREGTFPFHDHNAPEIHGIIVSGDNDVSKVLEQHTCTSLDTDEQAGCIEIYFRNITETIPFEDARSIFFDIAVKYPSNCHTFAHDLGKSAYRAYLDNTLTELGQEEFSCGFGFWHGFTSVMQANNGFSASKDFCASLTGSTETAQEAHRINCYHGIGIGLIPDPPPSTLYGDFNSILKPALAFCDTIDTHPIYRERCLTGAYHAMTIYMVGNSYGFTFNEDSLGHCRTQGLPYQEACFTTLAAGIPEITDMDLSRIIEIVEKHAPLPLFKAVLESAMIVPINADTTLEEVGNFMEDCGAQINDLRQLCVSAVINRLFNNGLPGAEFEKAISFCSGSWIQNTEKEFCFHEVASYSSSYYDTATLRAACNMIPSEYRDKPFVCQFGNTDSL